MSFWCHDNTNCSHH